MKASRVFPLLGAVVLLLTAGPLLAPYDPMLQLREAANSGPSAQHWLGTDEFGRDVLSRFLAGGSWSMVTGAAATTLVLGLGWVAGGFAGFRRGFADHLIMRSSEVMLSIPWLYLLIGLRAAMPLSMRPRAVAAAMVSVIALVSWARPARLVRGVVLSLSEKG